MTTINASAYPTAPVRADYQKLLDAQTAALEKAGKLRHDPSDDFASNPALQKRIADGIDYVRKIFGSGSGHTNFATGVEAATAGHEFVESLKDGINHYNTIKKTHTPDYIAKIRAFQGDQAADHIQSIANGSDAEAQKTFAFYQAQADNQFRVSGSLVASNEDGSYAMGAFALSYQGSGFDVRIGSDAKAFISQGGDAFQLYDPPAPVIPTPNTSENIGRTKV